MNIFIASDNEDGLDINGNPLRSKVVASGGSPGDLEDDDYSLRIAESFLKINKSSKLGMFH